MSIIDHTSNKYDILFHTYLHILALNLVYVVMESGYFVLEISWKIIFPCLWEPSSGILTDEPRIIHYVTQHSTTEQPPPDKQVYNQCKGITVLNAIVINVLLHGKLMIGLGCTHP